MQAGPSILVVIPARAGSRGLKGKNRRRLGNATLLEWSVQALQQAGLRHLPIMVSSDDRQLMQQAKRLGIPVPYLRPRRLATATASLVDVVLDLLNWLKAQRRPIPQAVLLLQLTSPLRSPVVLRQAIQRLTSGVEAVVGVKRLQRTPQTLFFAGANGKLMPLVAHGKHNLQRQQIRPLFTPNGGLYLVRCQALRQQRTFLPKRTIGLEMNAIESLDLDDVVDWQMIEAVVDAKLTWRDKGRRKL